MRRVDCHSRVAKRSPHQNGDRVLRDAQGSIAARQDIVERHMDAKQEILDIPRALRETLEKGRPEYEALVRRTRWGEGPIYMVASGPAVAVGLTGALAFESLLGWPVVVRTAADFAAYSLGVLRPRSVVLAIPAPGRSSETLEVVRAARARGAVVLVLTSYLEDPLAKSADGIFLVRVGEESDLGWKALVCRQAALGYVALVAAQALKRHQPQIEALAREFEGLPARVEWVMTQVPDAVRSFAAELNGLRSLYVVGGGFYYPVALQWAGLLRRETKIHADGHAPEELIAESLERTEREAAVVFLCGSRCRVKKAVHQLASAVKRAGKRVLSVIDNDDRELAERSELAILLPPLSEMVGATRTLVLLEWVTYHAARERGREPPRGSGTASFRRLLIHPFDTIDETSHF